MQGRGHLQVLLPIVEGLRARGRAIHVFTHVDFRDDVERAGGHFIDLFKRHPMEAADATSIPFPSRLVSFAGVYAEKLVAEVAALAPALVLYDTFSVVAPVVARHLGVPYVNVCPNHAPVPARVLAALREDPRVNTSPECWAAVSRLRDLHGISNAGPFWYAEALSPFLNLYPEPAEFLATEDRDAFEPIAFFGSLAPTLRRRPTTEVFARPRRRLRVYMAFGTVIWWYFEAVAYDALRAIVAACADLEADLVIGLGGHRLDAESRAALQGPNVRLLEYADQWAALGEADVFITHHGLNSTHEAIFHQVPMISYPLFSDQPALASRCQELGLAVPLVSAPRAPIEPAGLHSAFRRLTEGRNAFAARLAEAHSWELRTIASRGAVLDQISALNESTVAPECSRR
jgi:MGT family glycosyltransferase